MRTWRDAADTLRADFAVNTRTASRITLVVWRVGQLGHVRRDATGFVLRRVHGVLDGLWTRGYVGAELPRSVPAGPGLRIAHEARGTMISPFSRIGAGVTIYHQVTLGIRSGNLYTAPVLGDGAYIGAGAKLIGPITIGTRASVGANAVVLADVPDGETWVGVPARRAGRTGAAVEPAPATGPGTVGPAVDDRGQSAA